MILIYGCAKKDKVTPPDPVSPNLTEFTVPAKTYGDAPFDLTAPKSNSPGAFKYTSSNSKVATIAGKTLTVKGSGTAIITAIQAASSNFLADSVKATFTVGLEAPGLGEFTIPNKKVGDPVFTLKAPSSKSPGAFTYKSVNPAIARVSGNKVTIIAGGQCSIIVTQAASGNYRADSLQATFIVTDDLLKPNITGFSIPDKLENDAPFTIKKPVSNSNGAFTYRSDNGFVAMISGNKITIMGRGSCNIIAYQAADGKYRADSIVAKFHVEPLIRPTLGAFTVPAKKSTDGPFTLTPPTSNSAGAFSYVSTNTAVATVSGNKVTIKGGGQTDIIATQAAIGAYASASARATLTVAGPSAPGTVTDVDGNVYTTVTIGSQVWLAQNLNVTHYSDGTPVPYIFSDIDWQTATSAGYCNYQSDINNAKVYGRIYNYYAVASSHKLAPKGFHIPSDAEWTKLYEYIGNTRQSGVKLQEAGTAHWQVAIGTNTTKFTALPGGGRNNDYTKLFNGLGYNAYWWSATTSDATKAWYYNLYVKGYLDRDSIQKSAGFSVRCIKD